MPGSRKTRGAIDPERGEWTSVVAILGFLLLCFYAVFTPGGPTQGTHGVILAAAGLTMLLFPPRFRIDRILIALGAALLLFSAAAFLPIRLFGMPEWRENIEALGVDTGPFVTCHPGATAEFLLALAISVFVAVFLLGHRVSSEAQSRLGLLFTAGVAVYAVISMVAQDGGWRFAWDNEESFGLFPNRNHSATLLVMGTLCGVGVLYHSGRRRQWIAAALAAASVGISAWAVLGYVESRAGVLLLAVGFVLWFAGIGRRYINHRIVISVLVLGGLAVILFIASDAGVKSRFEKTFGSDATEEAPAEPVETDNSDAAQQFEQRAAAPEAAFDFRVVIYRDTLKMIASEPVTGIGLGMFPYVFAMYRDHSASNALCVHPESDWLTVIAETGVVPGLILLAIVVLLFRSAVKNGRKTRSWPLRLGFLVAAAVIPLHGLFDVPGHRIGLAYFGLILLALGSWRPESSLVPMRLAGRAVFRSGGLLVLLLGVLLVRGEWYGGSALAVTSADAAAAEIRRLHALDQAEQAAAAATESGDAAASDGVDKLELALDVAEKAIAVTPLVPELHYLRGAMALYYDDKDDLVDRSFAAQRLLDPVWTFVPMRQAQGWMPIDPERTLVLWQDALRRAEQLAATSESFSREPGNIWSAIVREARQSDALLASILPLADDNPAYLRIWIRNRNPAVLRAEMPRILQAGVFPEGEIDAVLDDWRRYGDKADVEAFLLDHPEMREIPGEPTDAPSL